MKRARTTAIVLTALLVPALAACTDSSKKPAASQGGATSNVAATGADKLAGVCPSTVVVQQDWEPEAEHSGVYSLIGRGYTIDANKKRVTGPLVIGGKDTGVKIQVRAGGSAIGFQGVTAEMYIDKSITLGAVSTDGAIGSSVTQPVTAVVSQLDKSPQMLMWDPKSHPSWNSIADAGKSGSTVLVSKGVDYASLLEEKGLIKPKQIDQGYTGAPSRFVTDPKIVQQGFATAEPYIYQHEIKQWDKPVKYQLLADVGYNIYPEALSVRTGELSSLAPCLKKLVPILQQAQIDYLNNPGPTNNLITTAVEKFNDGWTYSTGVANYAASTMKQLGIVTDDASGALGGMDLKRVQSAINTFGPILKKGGAKVKSGLTAADIATDRFIDTHTKLD
ncbi:MAG TPA: nitrate ABC transporter substrate-binding protein [Mycobacteriales bacterium]|nr:nitrate ABC transporter substrate-binding protein [Mycobacteriales bacterium]